MVEQWTLSRSFQDFLKSKKAGGIVIMLATVLSLLLANSPVAEHYLKIWHMNAGGLSVEHWINDGLMAIFFLLIGLELERELYNGELSNLKNALLPIVAALGGIVLPATIYFMLNFNSDSRSGVGIPMATDIAFALGVLALLGSRIPASLKVFLTALAVIDDLGAILIIAVFYTKDLSVPYLAGAALVALALLVLNRMRVMKLAPYLIAGILMWVLMLKSGVHATITGVVLAFVIPFSAKQDDEKSPSHRLEHVLHKPVAFVILPIFALANTAVVIGPDWAEGLMSSSSLGIIGGLLIGKPLGITLLSFAAVAAGICQLPESLRWRHVIGAGLLGGIGFTMSIFITNLAFPGQPEIIDASKIAILGASFTAGILGFLWLKQFGEPEVVVENG